MQHSSPEAYSHLGRKIIFIMTDTQRTDMVGCYGHPDMKTPAIDSLAAKGVRYEWAFSCQPVCGPARSAIFTGLYPHSNGSWANSIPLGANVKTVGQRLRDNRFHTAYIGKYHLDGSDYFGLGYASDGWDPDYWYDMRNYLEEMTDLERYKSRNQRTMDHEAIPVEKTYAHQVSNRAIDFIKENRDDDYFLVVSYDEPHDPYLCPEPYCSMYEEYEFPKSPNVWDDLQDKPDYQRVWAGKNLDLNMDELHIYHKYFFGCNSFVDSEIGRVLETIEDYAEDALIIYTSDHGDALFSHSLYAKGPSMYDEICRIPLIIYDPSSDTPGGSVCEHPASHIDMVPTILDYAGLPQPKILEGKSMRPMIEDPSYKLNNYIFSEFNRYEVDHDGFGGFQPMRSCFDGRYKLSIHLLSQDELYDMQEDPAEMFNLIDSDDHKDVRNKLHDEILDWMNRTRDPFRGYYWERRPWRDDARKPTWDYTGYTRQRENEEYERRQLNYSSGLPMLDAVRPNGTRENLFTEEELSQVTFLPKEDDGVEAPDA